MIDIADVASFQGAIDWRAYAPGRPAAICKATEGTNYVDPTFAQNWAGIAAAGLMRIAYHFPRGGSLLDEVGHFLATVGQLDPTDGVMLDWEPYPGMGLPDPAWGLYWLAEVAQRTGRLPLLYGNAGDLGALASLPGIERYPVTVAAYPGPPAPPGGMGPMLLHQWTDAETFPGIPSPCDGNHVLGDLALLTARETAGPDEDADV